MGRTELRLAGWLCFIEAALTIPYLAFALMADTTPGSSGAMANVVLNIINLSVFAYILFCLKQLLNDLDFHQTDTPIDIMILLNALVVLVSIAEAFVASLQTISLWFSAFSLVALGVAGIVFSLRLKHLEHDLWGLHRPYWRSFLVASIAYLTIVLLPIGLLAGIVSSITLGRIFRRAGEHLERAA